MHLARDCHPNKKQKKKAKKKKDATRTVRREKECGARHSRGELNDCGFGSRVRVTDFFAYPFSACPETPPGSAGRRKDETPRRAHREISAGTRWRKERVSKKEKNGQGE
jgi:hypothetical protein